MVVGPVTAVLAAYRAGAASVSEVGRRTGLRPDVVAAATEHLVRCGRLQSLDGRPGCPAQGCAGCAVARSCAGRRMPGG